MKESEVSSRPVLFGRDLLVVEDQPELAEALSVVLRSLGATTSVAHDSREALAALQHRVPDVIVADIGLPEHDGIWLARRVAASFPTVKLIAMTGFRDPALRRAALAARYVAVLPKPLDLARLVKTIVKACPECAPTRRAS